YLDHGPPVDRVEFEALGSLVDAIAAPAGAVPHVPRLAVVPVGGDLPPADVEVAPRFPPYKAARGERHPPPRELEGVTAQRGAKGLRVERRRRRGGGGYSRWRSSWRSSAPLEWRESHNGVGG